MIERLVGEEDGGRWRCWKYFRISLVLFDAFGVLVDRILLGWNCFVFFVEHSFFALYFV